ncbi:sigma D regulator [Alteromonas sp. C1M14]|uniref:sigma D regulator n=1 Tax=Alteromonas sp. C1M14 TaxID=2841567 RepID=UPI001C0A3906|nr:sigma D regulator [Alteromonas sp. C1M14]MBU2980127.1 sigma D regulator [Alteromonas sp. C1M14]
MLNKLEQAKEKWGGASGIIDNWLKARQQLLVRYCELAGLSDKNSALPDAQEISEFCTLMMDYCSAGHFGIYDQLTNTDDQAQSLKERYYPQIARTTDKILAFSDHYSDSFSTQQASSFDNELASLGEVIEERLALEDELITHMYQRLDKLSDGPRD